MSYPDFQFDPALNISFLHELFGHDTAHAALVFEDVANEIPAQWNELETAYTDDDVQGMKTAAHKCKTLYAYVGCASIQQRLQVLETGCERASRASELAPEMEKLRVEHPAALTLVKKETERLKAFA